MSKVAKAVKKVFKKVGQFVKKHWKWIVLAAAVYFTVGMAMGAFAPASTVVAGGAPATGSAYTAAAVGGQSATLAAGGSTFATTAATAGSAALPTLAPVVVTAPASAMAGVGAAAAKTLAAAAATEVGYSMSDATAKTRGELEGQARDTKVAKAMSAFEKIMIAKIVADGAAGLTRDKGGKEDFKGAFWGYDKKGRGAPVVGSAISAINEQAQDPYRLRPKSGDAAASPTGQPTEGSSVAQAQTQLAPPTPKVGQTPEQRAAVAGALDSGAAEEYAAGVGEQEDFIQSVLSKSERGGTA